MAYPIVTRRLSELAVPSLVIAGALVAGALVSVAGVFGTLLLAGALAAVFVLFLPAAWSLWLLFIVELLLVGQLTYFGGFAQAFWLSYLLVSLLVFKVPIEMLARSHERAAPSRRTPLFLACLYLFLLVFAFSAVLNRTGVPWLVATSKNYLFVWSIVFLVGLGMVAEESLERLWRFFLLVGLLQLPFALIERFYFAARRGVINWDAVVGTFGGDPDGGGASGTMAFFLVFAMLVASALFAERKISARLHAAVLLSALATVALAEVKIVFIILPLGYLWLFRREIPRHPGKSLALALALVTILGGIVFVYTGLYESKSKEPVSGETSLERIILSEANPNFYNPLTREVSRAGALIKWWVLNPVSQYDHFFFGHGPGASRESKTAGDGVAARMYPFTLSTSAASVLLWDTGLVGYAAFLLVLALGARQADRAARNPSVPSTHRSMLRANATALLLIAMMTVYNRDANNSAAIQFLIAAMLGHVLFMTRKYPSALPVPPTRPRTYVPVPRGPRTP